MPSDTPPRRAARYPFVAKVSLSESLSNTRVSGLTTDLSEGGCCVRVTEVFARGTLVDLEIIRNGETLRIPATVAYGLPPNVMGLSFGDMNTEQRTILERWIEQAIPSLRRSLPERETSSFEEDSLPVDTQARQKN